MTSANHVAGGIAITGISLSFWNINIFSDYTYLGICVFASLLPDIDHTKSIIGKMFYPISKYLDKKFGHRTITHSLTFFIPAVLFISFLELNFINPYYGLIGINYTLIFSFALFSHLILDMLTVQGIPLFYPFLRNPCVVPANPSFRIRSGNMKSETIALAIFTLIIFSSYDLFQNGFWTSYNRAFGTIKHVNREFRKTDKIISTTYDFYFNGTHQVGEGYVIEASESKLDIYVIDNLEPRIITIDQEDIRFRNIKLEPLQTNHIYSIKNFDFNLMTAEELNKSLLNKTVSGTIESTSNFILSTKMYNKGKVKLDKMISPNFEIIRKDTLDKDIFHKIKIAEAKLYEINYDNFKESEKLRKMKSELYKWENDLNNTEEIYNKNKLENLIISHKRKLENHEIKLKPTMQLTEEINNLNKLLVQESVEYFSGNLQIFELPENTIMTIANSTTPHR